jgi:monothiol glutaredoxin
VTEHAVVLFMKGTRGAPQCGFSAAAVGIFEELGVPFETRDVLADPALRQGIKDFSDWPTLPQVYVGREFVGGSDIIAELHTSGELKQLISAALAG